MFIVLGSTGSSAGSKSSNSKKHKPGSNGSQRFWPASISKINSVDNTEGEYYHIVCLDKNLVFNKNYIKTRTMKTIVN